VLAVITRLFKEFYETGLIQSFPKETTIINITDMVIEFLKSSKTLVENPATGLSEGKNFQKGTLVKFQPNTKVTFFTKASL